MTVSPPSHRQSAIRRPIAITIVGWLFVLVGMAGLIAGVRALMGDLAHASAGGLADGGELGLVLAMRAIAVAGGALILYDVSWGRWLLIAWMAWHVALSLGHTPGEVAVHAVFLLLLAFVLFNRQASAYFGTGRAV